MPPSCIRVLVRFGDSLPLASELEAQGAGDGVARQVDFHRVDGHVGKQGIVVDELRDELLIAVCEVRVEGVEVGILVAELVGQVNVETLPVVAHAERQDVGRAHAHIAGAGGVVYGARMNDFMVHHVRIDSIELLGQLRGSKYLQSSINTTFIQAEEDLKAGKVVLFSGTPCQIDGLIKFLGHEYEKLITVDIVCHGVGSQAYFDKFISYVKSEMPQLREAKFRSKRYSGWSVTSGEFIVEEKPGKRISKPFYNHKNYYYRYFLEGSIYRKSCYSCKYANLNRPGDFTLGDFWGVEKLRLPINTYYGCSLIIVNTVKAEKFLKHLPDIELESVRIEDAVKDNEQLLHPSKLVDVRNERIIDYETKTGKEIAIKYKNKEKKQILKGTLKMAIPYSVKTIIRSLRK